MLESALILLISLLLDQLMGEARRFHPLVGFGWCANKLELIMNKGTQLHFRGHIAVLLLIIPFILLGLYLQGLPVNKELNWEPVWLIEIVILYLAIGRKSLTQHAEAIIRPLNDSDLETARKKLSYIVSRDTAKLPQQGIIKATIESVIENSNDAIFAAIFWFLVAGIPGVICYRLVNTLDAMWGYNNKRYSQFGWAAAKLDDAMNWLPARLTVISFAFFGHFLRVLKTAFKQGASCNSPNAGPVMAAGACSLNIKLGGEAFYKGKLIAKPELGYGNSPEVYNIRQAITLVNKSLTLWLICIFILSIIIEAS